MARRPRTSIGGLAYHVMNRVSGRQKLFAGAGDYEAFERVLAAAREREGMRACAYAMLPDHFHLVLWPRADGALSLPTPFPPSLIRQELNEQELTEVTERRIGLSSPLPLLSPGQSSCFDSQGVDG